MVFPFPTIVPIADLSRVSFVTSTAATQFNGSLTMPSSIEAGDIIIVGQEWYKNTTADYPGSGFTSISNLKLSSYYYKNHVSYKIADGSEAGTSISGFADQSANNSTSAGIYVYRPNAEVKTVTQVNKYTYLGTGNPAVNILYGSTSDAATIALAVAGSNNYPGITFTGATADAEVNLNNGLADLRMRAYGANKGESVDITTDMTDVGANFFTSVLLELT